MSPVSQSCQGHLNCLSTFLADWMKKIRAEWTDKTIPFVPNELFSEQPKGYLPAATGALLMSVSLGRGVLFCRGSHCSSSCEHQKISLHSPSSSGCCQTVLCAMARSPSPSVPCIRPSAGPELAQPWPYPLCPITHPCAGKGAQQLQSQCETHLPTSPPSANNGVFSSALLRSVRKNKPSDLGPF